MSRQAGRNREEPETHTHVVRTVGGKSDKRAQANRLVCLQRPRFGMQGRSLDSKRAQTDNEGSFCGRPCPTLKREEGRETRGPCFAALASCNSNDCTLKQTHGVRTETKVLVDLSSVLGSSEKNGVATLGCSKGELVQSQAFTTGSLDSLAGSSGEPECGDAELLLEVDKSDIVGDGSNNDNGLLGGVGLAVSDLSGDLADAQGSSVGSTLIQALQNCLVKVAVGPSGEESVELDLLNIQNVRC